ncbi:MAG: hypothetical protein CMM31_01825 [Rhodospirillaceae bacterium]|nr:hypothetical protein [Rhodospirillaceae bacterium]
MHFECCYYAAIEHCLRQGIRRFEAGAQGDFKRNRGLDAQPTRSMHHLAYPPLRRAVADFLRRERQAVDETVDVLRAHTAAPRREPEGSDGGFPAEPPHDKTS